jgi:hypothetical protein
MKTKAWIEPFKSHVRVMMIVVLVSVALVPISLLTFAGEGQKPTTPEKPSDPPGAATSPKTNPENPPKKISGAELYSMHCNRCHPERYPTERTAAQWKTIMLHMRVRANLPGDQARLILKYLQDNSGR